MYLSEKEYYLFRILFANISNDKVKVNYQVMSANPSEASNSSFLYKYYIKINLYSNQISILIKLPNFILHL